MKLLPKRSKQARKKRETELVAELSAIYGYMFADTLPDKDRTSMIMQRGDGKTSIRPAFGIKLIIPSDGALGVLIATQRAERNPATSSSAKARAKDRAKHGAKKTATDMTTRDVDRAAREWDRKDRKNARKAATS